MKKLTVFITFVLLLFTHSTALAFDDKRETGAVVGAVVGGVVGNQIGEGAGNTVATIIGVVAGSLIGASVGDSLDRMDRRALRESQWEILESDRRSSSWYGSRYGSRTGSYGNFRVLREGRHRLYPQETCKTYRSEIYARYKREVRTETTCRRADGSWYEARNRDVIY